jgi:hypothetical protein
MREPILMIAQDLFMPGIGHSTKTLVLNELTNANAVPKCLDTQLDFGTWHLGESLGVGLLAAAAIARYGAAYPSFLGLEEVEHRVITCLIRIAPRSHA